MIIANLKLYLDHPCLCVVLKITCTGKIYGNWFTAGGISIAAVKFFLPPNTFFLCNPNGH